MERTLVILKPDAVRRKLVGELISRFERKNIEIVKIKLETMELKDARIHYAHVEKDPVFNDMISYMTSGPSVFIILQGERVIQAVRGMIGKTKCYDSVPGTIRGDYGYHNFENLIHASDSVENAEVEISRFFL